jgi:hypothetical protein
MNEQILKPYENMLTYYIPRFEKLKINKQINKRHMAKQRKKSLFLKH